MISLVIGGSGSGKSEYAESLILEYSTEKKIYLATMNVADSESQKRIERHRKMRAGKGFETVEGSIGLKHLTISKNATVLVECLSNLVANEMFMELGAHKNTKEEVIEGINHIVSNAENAVFVSNNIFEDGVEYDQMTNEYLATLSEINKYITTIADSFVEVVHGIPIVCHRDNRSSYQVRRN